MRRTGGSAEREVGAGHPATNGLAPAPRGGVEPPRGDAAAGEEATTGEVTTADLRKVRWGCVQGLLAGALHPRVSDSVSRQLEGMLDEKLADLTAGGGKPITLIEGKKVPASGGAADGGSAPTRKG